jgi:DNA-binding MarR family transcriptional regulator
VSAETFNDALEQFFRSMRSARLKPGPIQGELTLAQHVLLLPLLEPGCDGCTVRTLAETAGIASPTATRTLDGLERDGLITRRPSETDRRSVLVALTDRGRELMLEAREARRAARAELYARLDPSEQAEAERILRRLTEILRAI